MKSFLYWAIQHKWLLFALAFGALLLVLPLPQDLPSHGRQTLVIAIVAIVLFITEPIPLPGIALLIAVSQVLFGIAPPQEVAHSFMNDSVFFILGSLMLAVVIVKQKLDKRLAVAIFRFTGPKIHHIVFGMIAVCAPMASVIGEPTVAAIMLPVVMSLLRYAVENPKDNPELSGLLLFTIAYSCKIAGLGTPSGGPRQAVMIEYWSRLSNIQISYFTWMKYSYPLVLLLAPILAFVLLKSFKPEKTDLSTAIRKLRAQVLSEGRMGAREWLTVGIFGVVLLIWFFFSGKVGLGIPALLGVSLYLIAGLVDWEDLNAGVNWGVFLIYASTMSLGVAIETTGGAVWVAGHFMSAVSHLGIHSGIPLIAAVSILVFTVSSFISRAAALGVLTPIVLNLAKSSGTNVLAMGFAAVMSSSFTYLTVIGSPPNTIIFSSGYLHPRDYLRAGKWMVVASILMMLIFARVYWRYVLPN